MNNINEDIISINDEMKLFWEVRKTANKTLHPFNLKLKTTISYLFIKKEIKKEIIEELANVDSQKGTFYIGNDCIWVLDLYANMENNHKTEPLDKEN